MYGGKYFARQVFYDVLGNREHKVIMNDKGIGYFTINGSSASVWTRE